MQFCTVDNIDVMLDWIDSLQRQEESVNSYDVNIFSTIIGAVPFELINLHIRKTQF